MIAIEFESFEMDSKIQITSQIKSEKRLLATRGIFCLLFLMCFSSVFSQIYVSEGTTFYNADASIKVSTSSKKSEERSSKVIYVSAGTTISKSDADGDFKSVKIESPEVRSVKKARLSVSKKPHIAKKESERDFDQLPEKEFVNRRHFSDKVSSEILISNDVKITRNPSNDKIKIANAFLFLFDESRFVIYSESETFLCSDFIFSNHCLTSFSVRPPPILG